MDIATKAAKSVGMDTAKTASEKLFIKLQGQQAI